MAFFAVLISGMIYGQKLENDPNEALAIVVKNKKQLKSAQQLIVVYNNTEKDCKAELVALEKKHRQWQIKFGPIAAYVGRNGFALPGTKYEGDGKSPTGVFRLGELFCYENSEKPALLHYTQTTSDDKWIDDPEAKDYNKHVRGATNAKSFEKLLIRSDAYKYCTVIEYNTHPVIKGKGSAIFFHLGEEPTSGCVTITEEWMKQILNWMRPKAKPSVLMGNIDILRQGL